MLITPESDTSSQNERTNKLPDNVGTTKPNHMNSDPNTSRCCEADGKKSNNNTRDKSENNCTAGLACLKITDKTKMSSSPSQQQGLVISPKFSHLAQKKSPRFVKRALFLNSDDDNEVFHQDSMNSVNRTNADSPTSCSPPRDPSLNIGSDLENKQLLTSGRLYLIRQIGNASQTSGSPSSPSRSFSKPFSFSPIGLSSPTSSPPQQHPLNSKRKLPVFVRVYKCNKDHFALISRDSSYSSRHIYLNMRHCRVMPGNPLGRFIVAGNSDSGSLMEFETTDLSSLEGWLDALQTQTPPESPIRSGIPSSNGPGNTKNGGNSSSGSPSLPKSPVLPTLTETDED